MDNIFLHRLAIQAEEAEQQGLTKLASHLSEQMEKIANSSETSPVSNMDVESNLWNLFIRHAAAQGGKFNAEKVQTTISTLSKDIQQILGNLVK